MLIFLDLNGIDVNFPRKELEDNMVKIATGETTGDDFLKWLKSLV
jgi:prophage maintenance system killer protein